MPDHNDNIIEEITHSADMVSAKQELYSSRRKIVNKYMVAIAVVLVALLLTWYLLSAEQITALHTD